MTQQPYVRPEPQRDRWGRYVLPFPAGNGKTGAPSSWQRATTLIKMASDTYHLDAWKQRNIAKGLALRPDLAAQASMLDVKADKDRLNGIVSQAMDAAGSSIAANLGTALHSMTEVYDATNTLDGIPEEFHSRMADYSDALDRARITIVPEYIERVTLSVRYQSAGTFDRIVKLSDGTYAIFDLKTGSDLSFGWDEIEAQLALYEDGVNSHGLWCGNNIGWCKPVTVRRDFGLVAHLPANGSGCKIYRTDMTSGHKLVKLCCEIRDSRKKKSSMPAAETGDPVGPDPYRLDAAPDGWDERLARCNTREELVQVAAEARAAGQWNERLANWARSYAKAIELGVMK